MSLKIQKTPRVQPTVGTSVHLRGRIQCGWGVVSNIRANETWCDVDWKGAVPGHTLPRIVHINEIEVSDMPAHSEKNLSSST